MNTDPNLQRHLGEGETFKENFETFFNTIDELLFVLDDRGCILHANDTVIQRLGYTREELVGQSVLMVHPPERREEAAQITAAMLAGKAEFCPVPVQTKDGVQIPVETRVKQGEWDGQPVLFGVSKDISRLKLSEEKFSKAFHASAALMAISYVNSEAFIDVNEAFLDTLGYAREEVIGHTSRELDLFVDPQARAKVLSMVQKTGPIRNLEEQVRAKNGAIISGLFSVDLLYIGDALCLLTVMTDITERKANEERERKAREFAEALHDIAQALNSTLDLDQVFDRILENIKRVLECDSANLLWVEGSSVRIVRTMSAHTGKVFAMARLPVLEQIARAGVPLVLSDVREHPGWSLLSETDWIRSYVAAPVIVQDELVCFISLNSATPGFYNASHLHRLRAFADQVAIAVKNARLYEQVAELATVDTLTGLYNRRHFIELANREILRARRYAEPLSVVMFDLDHYKRINDRHGHQAGDRVLAEIASLCRANLRGTDIACRYGGDEITILLPNTCLEQAMQFAERLRGLIESARIPNGKKPLKITASIGVAAFQPESNTLETLLGSADRALYLAKQGRNRIVDSTQLTVHSEE
jgi:diguanylate cyclase (GGDEF)-like protein/PAS domain S-box-containing protein